ncbi:MAG: hypothetical protein OEV08_02150 [Nitrospira sp.]|nr:hypothetical protein [Nitrospira sp.]
MLRHPHYLEVPWHVHWEQTKGSHRHLWWLIALVVLALFLVGVGVTSGVF